MQSQNAHVFISYSRRNIEFAKLLVAELSKNQRDVWVDWEDIPRAADWMQEIYSGIDKADTVIFIVSEASLISEICNQELRYALNNNKRVIPVILQQIENEVFDRVEQAWKSTNWYPIAQKNWDAIKHLNWLFFDDSSKHPSEFQSLAQTVDQDLFHIKTHTRLLVRAQEWRNKDKNPSSLLAGDDIISAEHWLQTYANKNPLPTDLHRDYILNSRQAENEKIARERALQNQARTRLQILVASFVLIILVMVFVLLPTTNNLLNNELGADTDFRLHEAAVSFEELIEQDLQLVFLSGSAVANFFETVDTSISGDDAAQELIFIRDEFGLQEISLYTADFQMGDAAVYYDGPEINHNERVQAERQELVQQAITTQNIVMSVIIGSPESQIAGAIPILIAGDRPNDLTLVGIALVAYHINAEYVDRLANILNVEAVIINLEEQIVASTFAESNPVVQTQLMQYADTRSLSVNRDDVYLDYERDDGTTLRMIQHGLVNDDGQIQGYLFVARSFDAVIELQSQIATMFLIFSGAIIVLIIILLIALVGIPMLRNRSSATT